ncbi:alpha-amylase/4-alpha-glucanotransferase domain-containing protein, partial [Gemmatimonadota bacterium]
SGHGQEKSYRFTELPPFDGDDRAIFVDRVLTGSILLEDYRAGQFEPLRSWAGTPLEEWGVHETPAPREGALDGVEITFGSPDSDPASLEKRLYFEADGSVEAYYQWEPGAFPKDAYFTTELSLGAEAQVVAAPRADVWRFPISTFSKSERGFDETVQGESVTVRWPAEQGWGRVKLFPKPVPES